MLYLDLTPFYAEVSFPPLLSSWIKSVFTPLTTGQLCLFFDSLLWESFSLETTVEYLSNLIFCSVTDFYWAPSLTHMNSHCSEFSPNCISISLLPGDFPLFITWIQQMSHFMIIHISTCLKSGLLLIERRKHSTLRKRNSTYSLTNSARSSFLFLNSFPPWLFKFSASEWINPYSETMFNSHSNISITSSLFSFSFFLLFTIKETPAL